MTRTKTAEQSPLGLFVVQVLLLASQIAAVPFGRRDRQAEFKAKVALEAIQGQRTIAELATRHELHPNLIAQWKRQAIEKLAKVFDDKGFEVQANRDAEVTKLHAKIGQLVVERDFLAKAFDR